MNDQQRLIFGKASNIDRIVSCEVEDNKVTLFRQDKDGNIFSDIRTNYYWMLSCIQLDKGFSLLEGNLYYKYIKLYKTKEEWVTDKKKYYKRDIYLINDEKEAAMVLFGFSYFQDLKVPNVSILCFDIETNGLTLDKDSYIYIISNTFRKNGIIHRKLFSVDDYHDPGTMITAWCKWVREVDPSIMCGHNIFTYDIPYLHHVSSLWGTYLKLGRDESELKINHYDSKFRKDGSQSYDYKRSFIFGREIVDTMFLGYKYDYSRKYPNYSLKGIIKFEGLEIEGRQFYEAGKIGDNWNNLEERKKIKAYAEQDGDDALALYDLMVPSYFYWTQSIPKSFQAINYTATGSQLNSFLVRSYLQEFHSIPKTSESIGFEGAVSFGIPGIYKNVFKVDVASLYPSIMLQYEVHDKYKDPSSNFLKMVQYFTTERLKNKKLGKETGDRYYKDLEQSQKIGINSAYGMLAAQVNFNSPLNAAFVTRKGREILGQAIEWASGQKTEYWTSLGDNNGEEETEEL